jgi:hypothetical protein
LQLEAAVMLADEDMLLCHSLTEPNKDLSEEKRKGFRT